MHPANWLDGTNVQVFEDEYAAPSVNAEGLHVPACSIAFHLYAYGSVPPDAAFAVSVIVPPTSIVTSEFGDTTFAGTSALFTAIVEVSADFDIVALDARALNAKVHSVSSEFGVNANEFEAGSGDGVGHPPDTVADHP